MMVRVKEARVTLLLRQHCIARLAGAFYLPSLRSPVCAHATLDVVSKRRTVLCQLEGATLINWSFSDALECDVSALFRVATVGLNVLLSKRLPNLPALFEFLSARVRFLSLCWPVHRGALALQFCRWCDWLSQS